MVQVPLVVIGGGLILDEDGDVSVEVLDFDQGSDCKVKIPGRVNWRTAMDAHMIGIWHNHDFDVHL